MKLNKTQGSLYETKLKDLFMKLNPTQEPYLKTKQSQNLCLKLNQIKTKAL